MAEQDAAEDTVRAGLGEAEMRDNVIRLAFGGDPRRLRGVLRGVLRRHAAGHGGRAAGQRRDRRAHGDHAPFDADGPGTSDLDLTLVGARSSPSTRSTASTSPASTPSRSARRTRTSRPTSCPCATA